MNNAELWQAALGEIELSISKANFSTWFKNTTILSNENGKVVIGVPNGFAKEWLENKYNTYIFKALRNFQEDIKEISCIIFSSDQVVQHDGKKIDSVVSAAREAHGESSPSMIFGEKTMQHPQSQAIYEN